MSAQKLKYLSSLLKNLPDTLPNCGDNSDYDALDPFILDKNHIVRIGDEVEAFCYVLDTIFKADSSLFLTTATASKPTGSHQPISTNTSFEMNDEDFNKLWES